jgi:pyruvate/2-oxoglutarate dehydrogenase complex dihydrolipoamide acyltransferase (E2) component
MDLSVLEDLAGAPPAHVASPEDLLPASLEAPIEEAPRPAAGSWNQPTLEIARDEMRAKIAAGALAAEAGGGIESPGTGPITPIVDVDLDDAAVEEVLPAFAAADVPVPAAPPPALPAVAFAAAAAVAPEPPPVSAPSAPTAITDELVEAIARRVVEKLSDAAVREVAWEVVPDLAEGLIKREIERLKAELQKV